jgi:hypothetical protein
VEAARNWMHEGYSDGCAEAQGDSGSAPNSHHGSVCIPAQRAGDGNRTRMTSLEGWSSAIELRPQRPPRYAAAVTG